VAAGVRFWDGADAVGRVFRSPRGVVRVARDFLAMWIGFHLEIAGGSRRHEPVRFHQEGTGAGGPAADDAGMAGTYPERKADPGQDERGTGDPGTARRAMIFLDASVIELLANGAMATPSGKS